MIGGLGEKFWLLINRVALVSSSFAHFVVRVQNAVHSANGTQINTLVEQAGVDFGGREIDKARLAQKIQNGPALIGVQRASGFRAWPRRPCRSLAAMQTGA